MGRLWALTFTPVIVMTFEFCQRGATVDTPFLTDLKTQTSPIERSVVLHIILHCQLHFAPAYGRISYLWHVCLLHELRWFDSLRDT